METVLIVLLILHFIGLASLLGGFLGEMSAKAKRIAPGMWHGVLTILVTGLALYALPHGDAEELNAAKFAVKLGILLVITALVFIHRKRPSVSVRVWGAIGLLTVANVAIAVAWT